MPVLKLLFSGIVGYLLGSVSSAVIISYAVNHTDIRNYGSGNAGATNMARFFGMGMGAATFLLDGAKTALSMTLGRLLGGHGGFLIAGFTCLLGHCFPLYFHFRGGKGISVGAAIGLMLDWRIFLLLLVVFFTTFALTRIVSVSSIMCALAITPLEVLVGIRDVPSLALGVASCVTVLIMHRENIRRLVRGEEKKFKAMRRKK